MVSVGSIVTDSDIVAIQNKIQAEASAWPTGRGVTNLTTDVVDAAFVLDDEYADMIDTNTNINANHCYCEGQGVVETHNGGVSLSLTADKLDHEVGDEINAAGINEINADIDNLVAQCDCDTYWCDCETYCNCESQCTCDDVCNCNADCQCSCYPLGCHPDFSCSCMCEAAHCYCNSNWGCVCDGQGCGCNNDCTCDDVCDCEYGG